MQIDIRPCCDGWAWFLIDATRGPEAIASSRLFLDHHQAVESAQTLMLKGITSITDEHPDRPALRRDSGQANHPTRKPA